MPHFTLRPAAAMAMAMTEAATPEHESNVRWDRDNLAESPSSPPPSRLLSTVDLPDQIRGVLRGFRRYHGTGRARNAAPTAKSALDDQRHSDVGGETSAGRVCLSDVDQNSERREYARVSLSCVLVVTAGYEGGRESTDDGIRMSSSHKSAAKAAQSRWRKVTESALKDDRPENLSSAASPSSYFPPPPVVVLTVVPPPPRAAGAESTTVEGDGSSALHVKSGSLNLEGGAMQRKVGVVGGTCGVSNKKQGVPTEGKDLSRSYGKDMETHAGHDGNDNVDDEAVPRYWTLGETMTSIEYLEPYLEDDFRPKKESCSSMPTAPAPTPEIESALDGANAARSCYVDFSTAVASSGAEAGCETLLSLLAEDDDAGSLGKAFDREGIEAALLRPDGHISWVARVNSSNLAVVGENTRGPEVDGVDDGHTLVMDLRRALDSCFGSDAPL